MAVLGGVQDSDIDVEYILSDFSRPTSLSPSLPAAPASGQGKKIAGCAPSPLQQLSHFEHFDLAEHDFHEEANGRHAELNSAQCSRIGIDKCFEGFDKDVGNGGFSRCIQITDNYVGFIFDTQTAVTASASVSVARGGKGVPAESARVGTGGRSATILQAGVSEFVDFI